MKKIFLTFVAFLFLYPAYNQNLCEGDTLAPSLTVIKMSTGIVDSNNWIRLFAIDFSLQASDNCSPENKLLFTFDGALPIASKINEEHYFKGKGKIASEHEFKVGKAQLWKPQYRSSEITANGCFYDFPSKKMTISCWDETFNEAKDSTNISLKVLNNFPCHHVNFHVSTLGGQGLTQFDVKVEASYHGFPQYYSGDHLLCANIPFNGLEICATLSKTDDASNGIGIKDLIILRNHILGINKITNPYLLIAGDVNNDGKLTASDLVELKKLLYGLKNSLPGGQTWMLFPKDFFNTDIDDPWSFINMFNKPNCQTINTAVGDNNFYFIAIKKGDLDFNAKP